MRSVWCFVLCACAAAMVHAEGFSFTIASPVAAQEFRVKSAVFVFRTEGCTAEPQITATAEGMVKGVRKTVELKTQPASQPRVFAVFQSWGDVGEWVVNLKGSCAGANAGALVPIGPKGFIRESAKYFTRAVTEAEVVASLKSLAPVK